MTDAKHTDIYVGIIAGLLFGFVFALVMLHMETAQIRELHSQVQQMKAERDACRIRNGECDVNGTCIGPIVAWPPGQLCVWQPGVKR